MKTGRLIAAIVLALCAIGAAYYTYSQSLPARAGQSSAAGGPPPGFKQPH